MYVDGYVLIEMHKLMQFSIYAFLSGALSMIGIIIYSMQFSIIIYSAINEYIYQLTHFKDCRRQRDIIIYVCRVSLMDKTIIFVLV